jgi:CBS-domain-containing membrane protein
LVADSEIQKSRFPPNKPLRAIIAFVMIGIIGALALAFKMPFLFPSIAPTAISVIHRPSMKQNRPTSIIGGHFIGIIVAVILLMVFGLYHEPSTLQAGFTVNRVLVCALAIGITTTFEENTPFYHPPAGATTLIVALGLMTQPLQLLGIAIGIIMISILAAVYEYFCPKASPEKVKGQVAASATV